jgi:hypothetical protein
MVLVPWLIEMDNAGCPASRPHAVVKEGTGEVEGCHATHEAAERQLTALNIAEYGSMKATILDDDAFRLLAIPFGGPIPSPHSPRGVDLDGEFFSERTDIRPAWLKARAVDWHHGADATLGREVIGKAVDPEMDDDGWWVTVWLDHGSKRLNLIKRLAEQGAKLFGSSESVSGLVKKAKTGEILEWPYWRQTLSTSPQNTHSVIRPLKAVLDDIDYANTTPAFWADIAPGLRDLAADLRSSSSPTGKGVAYDDGLLESVYEFDRAIADALAKVRAANTNR